MCVILSSTDFHNMQLEKCLANMTEICKAVLGKSNKAVKIKLVAYFCLLEEYTKI